MFHWSIDPIALAFGPLTVRWYGIFFLAGFYIGYYYMVKVCRWENRPTEKLDSLLIYLIAGTTIGARLGHCLFYEWDYYSQHLMEIPMIWKGGLASHGGGAGVLIALFLFSKRNPEFSFTWLCDRISVPLVLTGALIRMGNFMNSEIVGRPTNGRWGVIFDRLDQVPRHPAQLYESFAYILVWLGALYWYRRYKHNPPVGLLFGWILVGIFTARIFIELIKENQEAFESGMIINMGQLLSIPYLLVGLWLFIRGLRAPSAVPESGRKKKATSV